MTKHHNILKNLVLICIQKMFDDEKYIYPCISIKIQITVERYYTPEQLKQLEEQRLAEERRREMEKLDNWRERGLNDMMGGVLQVRREDELKKVVQFNFLYKKHYLYY